MKEHPTYEGLKKRISELESMVQRYQSELIKYKTMFESSMDAIFLTNPNGEIYQANPAACSLFQMTESEFKRDGRTHIYNENDPKLKNALIIRNETGRFRGILEHKKKDGTIFPAEVSSVIYIDQNGKKRTCTIIRDVTEQEIKKAESEKIALKYKILFESFPYGITISDTEGNIIETNFEAKKILGLGKHEHEQRAIDGEEWKIIRPDGSDMPPEEWASVIALKEKRVVSGCEMGIVKSNNYITWINVTAAPLPSEGGGVVVTYNDITQKKQTEKSLKESEYRFRQYFENSGVYGYQVSKDGVIIDVNERVLSKLGYSRDELVGQPLWKIYSGKSIDKTKKLFKEFKITKKILNEELYIRTKNGDERCVILNADAVVDHDGEILHSTSIQTDITDRKIIERELFKLKNRNTIILETIPDLMFILSVNGEILDFQTNDYNELVVDPQKVIGSNISDSMPENIVATIMKGIRLSLSNNHLQIIEYRLPVKKGVEDYEARITPLDSNSVLAIVRNITEKKLAEKALRESKDMFMKSFMNAPVLCFISKIEDWTYLEVNNTFVNSTGYERDVTIGRTSVEIGLIKKKDRDYLKKTILKQGGIRDTEFELTRSDGSQMICLYSGELIESGGVKRLLSIAIDITDRKNQAILISQKQVELVEQSKKLEEMNTALNVLLDHRGQEKEKFKKDILENFKKLVFPYFPSSGRSEQEGLSTIISIIERNTKEILLKGDNKNLSLFSSLTPMESRIAQLIKEGKTSKGIANALQLSVHTVYFHRENVRKKLNLTKSKTNLKTYLQSQF